MTAVRRAVDSSPKTVHPAQCTSRPSAARRSAGTPVGFGFEAAQDVVERSLERSDAFALQGAADIIHVHPEAGETAHHLASVRHLDVDHAGKGAVVLEGPQRVLR